MQVHMSCVSVNASARARSNVCASAAKGSVRARACVCASVAMIMAIGVEAKSLRGLQERVRSGEGGLQGRGREHVRAPVRRWWSALGPSHRWSAKAVCVHRGVSGSGSGYGHASSVMAVSVGGKLQGSVKAMRVWEGSARANANTNANTSESESARA